MNIRICQVDLNGMDGKMRLQHVRGILEGMEGHPDLIMLPELWTCGFCNYDGYNTSAETLEESAALNMLKEQAKRLNSYIFGGSFVERDGDRLYNTSVLIDRDGKVVKTYRKIHLFGYESRETEILTRGDNISVAETEFGAVGLNTCYDLRFPEQFRKELELGAEIFLVGADWPLARLHHWQMFTKVRALENQSFLVACNCAGGKSGGHSCVVTPEGTTITEAGEGEEILVADIDVGEAKKYRRTFPAVADTVKI